jgi:imidazolonepropionase-like amidohydrolase
VKNVTVVTGAGDPLEKAIVLLADGLIEAVGKGIPIPADAWVVDGEGLTLYPGLVDSLTTLGLKKEEEDSGGAAGRHGPPPPTSLRRTGGLKNGARPDSPPP